MVPKESVTHSLLRACVVMGSYRDVTANAHSRYPEGYFFSSVVGGHGENQLTTKDWLILGADWTCFFF